MTARGVAWAIGSEVWTWDVEASQTPKQAYRGVEPKRLFALDHVLRNAVTFLDEAPQGPRLDLIILDESTIQRRSGIAAPDEVVATLHRGIVSREQNRLWARRAEGRSKVSQTDLALVVQEPIERFELGASATYQTQNRLLRQQTFGPPQQLGAAAGPGLLWTVLALDDLVIASPGDGQLLRISPANAQPSSMSRVEGISELKACGLQACWAANARGFVGVTSLDGKSTALRSCAVEPRLLAANSRRIAWVQSTTEGGAELETMLLPREMAQPARARGVLTAPADACVPTPLRHGNNAVVLCGIPPQASDPDGSGYELRVEGSEQVLWRGSRTAGNRLAFGIVADTVSSFLLVELGEDCAAATAEMRQKAQHNVPGAEPPQACQALGRYALRAKRFVRVAPLGPPLEKADWE